MKKKVETYLAPKSIYCLGSRLPKIQDPDLHSVPRFHDKNFNFLQNMTLKQGQIKKIDHSNSGFTLQHNLAENVPVSSYVLTAWRGLPPRGWPPGRVRARPAAPSAAPGSPGCTRNTTSRSFHSP
jgi:hypothetical protein